LEVRKVHIILKAHSGRQAIIGNCCLAEDMNGMLIQQVNSRAVSYLLQHPVKWPQITTNSVLQVAKEESWGIYSMPLR